MNRYQLLTPWMACLLFAASGNAESKPMLLEWEYETPLALPQAMILDPTHTYLFVALKNGGLSVFDVSQAGKKPILKANLPIRTFAQLDVMNLTRHKNILYLALGDFFNSRGSPAGLAIVDIEKPSKPKLLGLWSSPEKLKGSAAIAVDGKYAYLGAMNHGIIVIDVHDSTSPKKVADFLPDPHYPLKNPGKIQHPNARGLAISTDRLFVANDAGGIRILNIENPLKIEETGKYTNTAMGKKQQAYNNIVIEGTVLYAAVDYAGLEILDISNPAKIRQLGWFNPWEAHTPKNLWFNSPGHTNQLAIDSREKKIYLSAGDSDLLVVNVAEKSKPALVSHFGRPADKAGVWGVALAPKRVYLAYTKAVIPFVGTWAGLKSVGR
ncbi:MAG: hypothetical protein R3B84_00360 [Zavarzinella sp.]